MWTCRFRQSFSVCAAESRGVKADVILAAPVGDIDSADPENHAVEIHDLERLSTSRTGFTQIFTRRRPIEISTVLTETPGAGEASKSPRCVPCLKFCNLEMQTPDFPALLLADSLLLFSLYEFDFELVCNRVHPWLKYNAHHHFRL